MSINSTGSLAGLSGCVGNLQAGQGLAEFSRQLTRGDMTSQFNNKGFGYIPHGITYDAWDYV